MIEAMAIAHVCLGCGSDLARQKPVREPRYGLALVTCRRCGTHSVRRRHPIWDGWRRFLRLDWTLSVLLVQVLLTIGIGITTLFLAPIDADVMARFPADQDSEAWRTSFQIAAACSLALAIVTGAWLRAGFSHLPVARVWAGWLMTLLATFAAAIAFMALADFRWSDHREWRHLDAASRLRAAMSVIFIPGAAGIVGLSALAWLGVPIGGVLLRLAASFRRTKWRYRRKRRRLSRSAM